ncbi:MAG: ribonuclease III [Balneolaceae bacterium]
MPQWFRSFFEKKADLNPELKSRIENLEGIVGFNISDPSLFLKALRHRSTVSQEQYQSYDSYERLEFLGDAVLDLIAAEILFNEYPKKDEGFLTKIRAKLVRGETLSELSKNLGLEELMELGERSASSKVSKNILADAFESLIAAIYITKGYLHAYQFVDDVIKKHLVLDELVKVMDNYKSALLEYTQAKKLPLPNYISVTESGPGHNRTFEVKVMVGENELGRGKGKSKKKAEQEAAKKAIEDLDL